jgi:hypothetical protein
MRKTIGIVVASLTILAANTAQVERSFAAIDAIHAINDQGMADTSTAIGSGGRIVRNPAQCAPDADEPVWSTRAALLGYACKHNENGG